MPERTYREPGADVTIARARLNGLDIDVTHQQSPRGDWEEVSITLRASPSFQAFGDALATANPVKLWAQAAQMMWAPWLLAARPLLEPARPRQIRSEPGQDGR
ncbi:hypothetical protein SAMN06265338_101954 [Rhodoblastus acidophilus]|uniref:Uncharacterized protein n=1 Tax=Rhodoblastus acidophilus TaxID=1074 RepID=A0A212QNZ6_RHOAC|nr:hypothetical protein [Rhodoblastus acidophilus]PPQ38945.1 hypothetical protein CKO16_08415 [Rhodoblastus acidophilus]SNB60958.1 hypothetical protein SAMN06265338_101954 [Rhodoblastus acidophilus]